MSVLIKGMEMPKNCYYCPFSYGKWIQNSITEIYELFVFCTYLNNRNVKTNTRDKDCPLIEVPPHGRLIDADALKFDAYGEGNVIHKLMVFGGQMVYTESAIDDAPTIIEAEGEDG